MSYLGSYQAIESFQGGRIEPAGPHHLVAWVTHRFYPPLSYSMLRHNYEMGPKSRFFSWPLLATDPLGDMRESG